MSTPKRNLADYEARYAASDFEVVQARMRKRMLTEWLRAWQPRRILEVGCGLDALFRHHSDFDRFVVVEPADTFAHKARKDAGQDPRIRVIPAPLEEAAEALADEHFDCILVSGLLHEVPDADALLASIKPWCGPDTQVHLNVPNARSMHRLLALEMGLIHTPHAISPRQQSLQQHRTFDLDTLTRTCQAHGFSVQSSGSYFVKPFTHQQMAQLMNDGMLNDALLDGLYRLEKHMPGLGSEIFVNLKACASPEGVQS